MKTISYEYVPRLFISDGKCDVSSVLEPPCLYAGIQPFVRVPIVPSDAHLMGCASARHTPAVPVGVPSDHLHADLDFSPDWRGRHIREVRGLVGGCLEHVFDFLRSPTFESTVEDLLSEHKLLPQERRAMCPCGEVGLQLVHYVGKPLGKVGGPGIPLRAPAVSHGRTPCIFFILRFCASFFWGGGVDSRKSQIATPKPVQIFSTINLPKKYVLGCCQYLILGGRAKSISKSPT